MKVLDFVKQVISFDGINVSLKKSSEMFFCKEKSALDVNLLGETFGSIQKITKFASLKN